MAARHGIRITPDTIDIVTFLNDGVRPEMKKDLFLYIEVNGPREITTKVALLEEINADLRSKEIHQLL